MELKEADLTKLDKLRNKMSKYKTTKLEENFIFTTDQLVIKKRDFDRFKFPGQD